MIRNYYIYFFFHHLCFVLSITFLTLSHHSLTHPFASLIITLAHLHHTPSSPNTASSPSHSLITITSPHHHYILLSQSHSLITITLPHYHHHTPLSSPSCFLIITITLQHHYHTPYRRGTHHRAAPGRCRQLRKFHFPALPVK